MLRQLACITSSIVAPDRIDKPNKVSPDCTVYRTQLDGGEPHASGGTAAPDSRVASGVGERGVASDEGSCAGETAVWVSVGSGVADGSVTTGSGVGVSVGPLTFATDVATGSTWRTRSS